MRFSLSSLVRLGVGAVLATSAAALVLARVAPAPMGWRMPCPVAYASINSFYLDPSSRGSVWIERDGGATVGGHRKGDDELIEYASFSPWRDEAGRCQVVGRWSWGFQTVSPETSYGLSRMSFPDGEVLDHIETDVVPVSAPCWYPGTRARVLFAAGDGKLYQCAFEPAAADAASDETLDQPRELTWSCPLPHEDGVYLTDPHWPSDPQMHNIIFAGLRFTAARSGERRRAGQTQIWWLRLNEDGSSILEAGRLIGTADVPDVWERCPTLGQSPTGRPMLAYFRKTPSQSMSLYLAEIEMDLERDRPRTVVGSGVKLAEDCLASPPVFSKDGRWLSIVQTAGGGRGLRRIRLEERAAAPSVAMLRRPAGADAASVQ